MCVCVYNVCVYIVVVGTLAIYCTLVDVFLFQLSTTPLSLAGVEPSHWCRIRHSNIRLQKQHDWSKPKLILEATVHPSVWCDPWLTVCLKVKVERPLLTPFLLSPHPFLPPSPPPDGVITWGPKSCTSRMSSHFVTRHLGSHSSSLPLSVHLSLSVKVEFRYNTRRMDQHVPSLRFTSNAKHVEHTLLRDTDRHTHICTEFIMPETN